MTNKNVGDGEVVQAARTPGPQSASESPAGSQTEDAREVGGSSPPAPSPTQRRRIRADLEQGYTPLGTVPPTPPEDVIREALALLLAKARTHGDTRMDNSHMPLPSEQQAARLFVEDHFNQLLTELEQVKAERDEVKLDQAGDNSAIIDLQAQLRTAREALEYYALESSWDSPQRDRGAIARQALTHLEGEKE